MRRTQKQTQYIRMTKDRLNPMPPAMRRLLDENAELRAALTQHHEHVPPSRLCETCGLPGPT